MPATAPVLPAAAARPLNVARVSTAKSSCGSTKVDTLGPQLTANVKSTYLRKKKKHTHTATRSAFSMGVRRQHIARASYPHS